MIEFWLGFAVGTLLAALIFLIILVWVMKSTYDGLFEEENQDE